MELEIHLGMELGTELGSSTYLLKIYCYLCSLLIDFGLKVYIVFLDEDLVLMSFPDKT
jgi:hypothetical protein